MFNIMGIHHMMGFHHMMDIHNIMLQIMPKAEHCTALISHIIDIPPPSVTSAISHQTQIQKMRLNCDKYNA